MKERLNKINLSGDNIKLFACIVMFIDHAAFGLILYYLNAYHMDIDPKMYTRLYDLYEALRCVGRLAFPIFCYFIVEGFFHTRNMAGYAIRMGVFAILSELPFDLCLYHKAVYVEHQNVMWTLLLGMLMMAIHKYVSAKTATVSNTLKYVITFCTIAAFCELAEIAHVDYGMKGILTIAILYLCYDLRPFNLIAGACVSSIEHYAPAAYVLLYFYNPGIKPKMKYFFYIFYPAHLLLIYVIGLIIFR